MIKYLVALAIFAMGCSSSCGVFTEERIKKTAAEVWDCSAPQFQKVIVQLGPLLDSVIDKATSSDGQTINTDPILAELVGLKDEFAGCLTAAIFRQIMSRAMQRSLVTSKPPTPEATMRETFRYLSVQRFGAATFVTAEGSL